MNYFKENKDKIIDYISHCKFVNVNKLMTRFDLDFLEAENILETLFDEGLIEPTVTLDYRVSKRQFIWEE